MASTNYLKNKLADHTLRGVPLAVPSALQLALYTVAPTATTSGTEVTGAGYTRKTILFSAPTNGTATNGASITFTSSGADWGIVNSFAIIESTTTQQWFFGLVDVPRHIQGTDQLTFGIGTISITFD